MRAIHHRNLPIPKAQLGHATLRVSEKPQSHTSRTLATYHPFSPMLRLCQGRHDYAFDMMQSFPPACLDQQGYLKMQGRRKSCTISSRASVPFLEACHLFASQRPTLSFSRLAAVPLATAVYLIAALVYSCQSFVPAFSTQTVKEGSVREIGRR